MTRKNSPTLAKQKHFIRKKLPGACSEPLLNFPEAAKRESNHFFDASDFKKWF